MRLIPGLLLTLISFLLFAFYLSGSHGHIMFRPSMKEDWVFWGLILISGLSGIFVLIRQILLKVRRIKPDNLKPIDINIVYQSIVKKLIISNNKDVITEMEKSAAGAVTGSEALINQGYYLTTLRNINPSVYKLIEEEIDSYIRHCKKKGLIIRA